LGCFPYVLRTTKMSGKPSLVKHLIFRKCPVTAVPPFRVVARVDRGWWPAALEPYFPELPTNGVSGWFGIRFDGRMLARWNGFTLATGSRIFSTMIFRFPGKPALLWHASLQAPVDTPRRTRSLELYSLCCDPYISGLFPSAKRKPRLSGNAFVVFSCHHFRRIF